MNSYEGSYAEDGTRLCRVCSKPKAYLNRAKEWVCKLCRPSRVAPREVPEQKFCKGCNTSKPSSAFHFDLRNKDGLQTCCKTCYENAYKTRKEVIRERQKTWNKVNQYKRAAYESFRRLKKRYSTPSWLTKKQLDEIEYKYWLARDLRAITGESYEVDHIVPVVNDFVSGLHVPWNLQILPSDLNRKKSNKMENY